MTFSEFCQYLQKLEETSSRLEMTAQLAELFGKLQTNEISSACYLMQGRLVPTYHSLEFQISDKLIIKALGKILTCVSPEEKSLATGLFDQSDNSQFQEKIKKSYQQLGDLGLVVVELLSEHLTDHRQSIMEVYEQLRVIATDGGEGSQDRKVDDTAKLLQSVDATSAKFIVRIVLGKVRLGFSTMTMIDALSWSVYQDKSDSAKIEEAFQKKADIGLLAKGYLGASTSQEREQFLQTYQLEVGVPVLPALCQRLNSAQEILEKMGKVIAEPKYDGLRAQIHLNKASASEPLQVFTRSLENVTHMFPEVSQFLSQINANECIFDAEAIGYDPATDQLLAFQQTITRKRKHNIQKQSDSTPIRFYLFDLLFVDGISLIDKPLQERRKFLEKIVAPNETIQPTPMLVTSDANELHDFHTQQLAEGLEGAVIKGADSLYRAGRKGWRWVKIKEKEGERGKLSDSLDCVVMGYYRGKGKRVKFGLGAFLVGVMAEDGLIKTIAKIGTGLTDDQFYELKTRADKLLAQTQPAQYDVPKELFPDVWLQPQLVVEVAADELTTSPLHSAGKALRFPRLIKFRDDKTVEQITSVSELQEIVVGK